MQYWLMLVACLAMDTKGGEWWRGCFVHISIFLHDIQSNFSN